jgi:hypothetical protein
MRLQIAAVSGFRQLHTVGLQAQALQNMLSLLFQFEHGGPPESLPWPSHVLSVLSVVYTTKNRGNKARRSFVPVLCPGTAGESFERVSVGLEHPDDIVEDVLGALDQV